MNHLFQQRPEPIEIVITSIYFVLPLYLLLVGICQKPRLCALVYFLKVVAKNQPLPTKHDKRLKQSQRDQKGSTEIERERERSTKWKKQNRKHPQGHCGPRQSHSGKWLHKRPFLGNQQLHERWHAPASCKSMQDVCLTSKSACVCVCVRVPMSHVNQRLTFR